ncbi:hypothetical protein BC828DRAFT_70153 [Blastocladiella britannica]|nr:hypothetical protein BC828DRAFT_70153 [Blastocladiella britannica]
MPSLMVCWTVANSVPTVLVPDLVMEKLFQAADLMSPGIFGRLPAISPGDVVGVALLDNPSVVLALGVALLDSHTIATTRKGKAVRIVLYVGDTVWEHCGKPRPPAALVAPPTALTTTSADDAEDLGSNDLNNDHGDVQPTREEEVDDAAIGTAPETSSQAIVISEDDVRTAFVLALADLTNTPSFASTLLPLSGSTLHTKYMNPHVPGGKLDFKATPWKKLAKFLKAMEKEFGASQRMLTIKENSKSGDVQVMSVNAQHPAITDARYDAQVAAKERARAERRAAVAASATGSSSAATPTSSSSASNASSATARVTVTALYQPTSSLAFIFPDRDEYFTVIDIARALEAYVTREGLVNPQNGRMVRVNDALAKYAPPPSTAPPPAAVAAPPTTGRRGAGSVSSSTAARGAKEIPTANNTPAFERGSWRSAGPRRGTAPPPPEPVVHEARRDDILPLLTAAMRPSHRIDFPATGASETRRGAFKRVEVTTERRQGKKIVTLVKNLASVLPGGTADLDRVQSEWAARCASSVGQQTASSATQGVWMVVQGNQIKELTQWVGEAGIAALVDFVPGK